MGTTVVVIVEAADISEIVIERAPFSYYSS